MKRTVLFSHPWSEDSIPHFAEFVRQLRDKDCEVRFYPKKTTMTEDDVIRWTSGVYAHICGGAEWTAKAMEQASDLKIIARIGVGYETVDVPAATGNGIVVATTPGAGAETVSEFAFALLLSLARGIVRNNGIVRNGGWESFNGPSVYRKTLGILGFGLIGRQLAEWARGFDMTVLAYDPCRDEQYAAANRICYAGFDEVMAASDFISLHLPLLPTTKGLIGQRELALMKPSAFLINTARGGIVDEDALFHALQAGRLAGAALDVFAMEPVKMDNPLLTMENVIVTPHMAGSSLEGLDSIVGAAVRNVIELIDGKAPHGILNPEVLEQV